LPIPTYRLGAITSSTTLSSYIRSITADPVLAKEVAPIRVSAAGLDAAIPVGRQMEKDGVEVIISRRGTAHMLRDALKIPVLSVPLSAFDILKCLKAAKERGTKILLPCFRHILSGVETMEELLHIEVFKGIYHDRTSLEALVDEARHEGCSVVIGAGVARQCAARYGLSFVEIETSRDVIDATLESAKSVAQANRLEQQKTQRYRAILESASEGMILSDRRHRVVDINPAARSFLKITSESVIGRSASRYLPMAPLSRVMDAARPVINKLDHIDQELFVFNHKPIFADKTPIGAITTFDRAARVMQTEHEVRRTLSKGLVARYSIDDLIYESAKMKRVVAMLKKFSTTDTTILISGETGTGKEIVAQSIHHLSRRKTQPFVSINCGALPDQLLESELFGYEEGAFTGSKKGGKPGLFEMAHRGTLLLDEISSTSHSVQSNLLRVLQEREVMRVGGVRLIPVDVRIIAVSNRDLPSEVQKGRFREDLFFRLNVLPIHIPPLRERTADIPLLLHVFVRQISNLHRLNPMDIPPESIHRLMDYAWPGNVRQLLNFSERLVLMCGGRFDRVIFAEHLAELKRYQPAAPPPSLDFVPPPASETVRARQRTFERQTILDALEKCHYKKAGAARLLGISRTTLWKKIKQLGL